VDTSTEDNKDVNLIEFRSKSSHSFTSENLTNQNSSHNKQFEKQLQIDKQLQLLNFQSTVYGTNMYESLEASDESKINYLVSQGCNNEQAVLLIFEEKFRDHPHNAKVINQNQSQV
jgi:hypothetical protein